MWKQLPMETKRVGPRERGARSGEGQTGYDTRPEEKSQAALKEKRHSVAGHDASNPSLFMGLYHIENAVWLPYSDASI